MNKIIVANSFSINMIEKDNNVSFKKVSAGYIAYSLWTLFNDSAIMAEFVPAIGHADTARIAEGLLNRELSNWTIPWTVPSLFNRTNITLNKGDILFVAQYRGQRLPEGATELPEGATIEWWQVTIQ